MKQSYFLVIYFCKNNTTNKKNGNLWRGLAARKFMLVTNTGNLCVLKKNIVW